MVVVVVVFDVSDVSDVSESAVVDEELPPLSVPQDIRVKLISKTTKNSKEDTAYVHLQYKNNLNVFVKNSWLSPVKIRKIKFKFTKGFLICDENESIYKIRIYRKTKKNSLN